MRFGIIDGMADERSRIFLRERVFRMELSVIVKRYNAEHDCTLYGALIARVDLVQIGEIFWRNFDHRQVAVFF